MKKCLGCLLAVIVFVTGPSFLSFAQEPEFPPPAVRTVVAEVLLTEGEFLIVRGPLGEIRIVVTPDTKMSEPFEFGDRIKALIRPDDSAISIVRAGPDEPIGVTAQAPAASSSDSTPSATSSTTPESTNQQTSAQSDDVPVPIEPQNRIIVADILMVDGDFYIVRSEYGEVRIEVTPDTKTTEKFAFGDRIKAKILPNDKAIYVKRAKPDDPLGFQTPKTRVAPQSTPAQGAPNVTAKPEAAVPENVGPPPPPSGTRKIVAEILMIDGDFIVIRGERGEIRIEVTDETKKSEKFQFGDKIRAMVLPNDRAISVERAGQDEPIGITEQK
ncbi:MAG: hypothetical protein NPIRA04_33830 [Nitrospirales bacterium]|nr:MAG: hypothetical protein NPIRA04_33830 [Nitrospirales bacterium]